MIQIPAQRRELGARRVQCGQAVGAACSRVGDRWRLGQEVGQVGAAREAGVPRVGRKLLRLGPCQSDGQLHGRARGVRVAMVAGEFTRRCDHAQLALDRTPNDRRHVDSLGLGPRDERGFEAVQVNADAITCRGCQPESPHMRSVSDIGATAPILHSPKHSVLASIAPYTMTVLRPKPSLPSRVEARCQAA